MSAVSPQQTKFACASFDTYKANSVPEMGLQRGIQTQKPGFLCQN